jgi:hypothetical protein
LALKNFRWHRVGRHDGFPLRPLGIAYFDSDRTTHGQTVADATNDPDVIFLEGHPSAPAMTEPAASQIVLDVLGGRGDTGRKTFQNAHERGSVRLTRCQPPKHPLSVSDQTCESVAGPLR